MLPRWGCLLLLGYTLPVALAEPSLPQQVREILVKNCNECHGPAGKEKDWGAYATNLNELVQRKKVLPGKSDKSELVEKITDPDKTTRMPPPDAQNPGPLSAAEIATIKQWIDAGAENLPTDKIAPAVQRSVRGFDYAIRNVHKHLRGLSAEDRAFQRYFLLLNLNNQSHESVSAQQVRTSRAALSKALNSLSWQPVLLIPVAIDPDQLIYNIDLRDLRWELNPQQQRVDFWRAIVERYPYGLTHESYPDLQETRALWNEIDSWTGTSMPWVRADWFITNALQPPLYHKLLFDFVLPDIQARKLVSVQVSDRSKIQERQFNVLDLEKFLQVDVARNIRMFRVMRSGDSESGVSTGPRILERHTAAYGAYWKSYDFKKGNEFSQVQQHPLGPPGMFRDVAAQEFDHDGGEIVFHLPNGLQGYLLVNKQGERIAFGPEELVGDNAKTLGSFTIVNGLSCISCHERGMKRDHTVDQVRTGIKGLPPEARDLVRKIYVEPKDFERKLDEDEKRFLTALENCTGSFREPRETGEPVKSVAIAYSTRPLDLEQAAAELGIDPKQIALAIENNPRLQRLGLTTLANRGTIKRSDWEAGTAEGGHSLFQRTALELRSVGTPGN